jgi:hypothetical protein
MYDLLRINSYLIKIVNTGRENMDVRIRTRVCSIDNQ